MNKIAALQGEERRIVRAYEDGGFRPDKTIQSSIVELLDGLSSCHASIASQDDLRWVCSAILRWCSFLYSEYGVSATVSMPTSKSVTLEQVQTEPGSAKPPSDSTQHSTASFRVPTIIARQRHRSHLFKIQSSAYFGVILPSKRVPSSQDYFKLGGIASIHDVDFAFPVPEHYLRRSGLSIDLFGDFLHGNLMLSDQLSFYENSRESLFKDNLTNTLRMFGHARQEISKIVLDSPVDYYVGQHSVSNVIEKHNDIGSGKGTVVLDLVRSTLNFSLCWEQQEPAGGKLEYSYSSPLSLECHQKGESLCV